VNFVTATRHLPGPSATEDLGRELALIASPGSAILIEGDVGAGKSTLARGFIRALALGDDTFDVPSPTFTLVQSYDQTRVPVLHADLYRIRDTAEIDELGLDEGLRTGLVVVEWPEKLSHRLTGNILHVRLEGRGGERHATLLGRGRWASALGRLAAISAFLEETGWTAVTRSFLEGDASFRRYERLSRDSETCVLMDMPPRPDGPPVRDNKPYSQIAHLAEDIRAVVAVNAELCRRGYSAPQTCVADLNRGLAIIEDLGNQVYGRMLLAGEDMSEPLHEAVRLLADIAVAEWPAKVPLPGGGFHEIPLYDSGALAIETSLLADWYWPHLRNGCIDDDSRAGFEAAWAPLFEKMKPGRPVWVLRDFHSPNLMWLPRREGLARVGIIDTQDAVLGHPAYDLVSLLQDARVDIATELANELYAKYVDERRARGSFDRIEFGEAFAILGAQRATKILGIFARLSRRDGKHGYLKHLPRVSRYLERNLAHPALAELREWYARHLPAALREGGST
jgi:hypothetical protein